VFVSAAAVSCVCQAPSAIGNLSAGSFQPDVCTGGACASSECTPGGWVTVLSCSSVCGGGGARVCVDGKLPRIGGGVVERPEETANGGGSNTMGPTLQKYVSNSERQVAGNIGRRPAALSQMMMMIDLLQGACWFRP
jgi:hypothetical protein